MLHDLAERLRAVRQTHAVEPDVYNDPLIRVEAAQLFFRIIHIHDLLFRGAEAFHNKVFYHARRSFSSFFLYLSAAEGRIMGKNVLWEAFMQKKAKSEQALALRVPGHPGLSDAKRLVFAALGEADWGVLEIEIIAGREESLLLARPASGIYISREALSRLAAHGR